jgi:DNA-binding NtrC family response regulator
MESAKMPARIIVVHDDHTFLDPLANALRADGHEVVAFDSPMPAWDALSENCLADMLITRIRFPVGIPHGVALARRAHTNRQQIRVVFTAAPEMAPYTDGLGVLLPTPISPTEVAKSVSDILSVDRAVA